MRIYIYIYESKIFVLENYFSQTLLHPKFIQNYSIRKIEWIHVQKKKKKKATSNPKDLRWIDDELSGHESTGKFPRSRNLTGIRLEILEKGVRVILVESCLPFNGNHREKLRGPRWLRTNVRCVAKERSERKKNERRTRKDSRIERSSSSRSYLWKLFHALESDGKKRGLSLNPGDSFAYRNHRMTNWIIILLGNIIVATSVQ